METLAAILIAAHVFGDFALQSNWLVKHKDRPQIILLHAAIHAVVAYLLLQAWALWFVPAYIIVVHAAIDLVKQRKGGSARAFVLDQVAHVASLLLLAWILFYFFKEPGFSGVGYGFFVGLAGFVVTVRGCGFLIGIVAKRITEENGLQIDGLINGGRWIGELERALIFLLIFIDVPAGIGFLVAAKSILRFEEAKKQKVAEYVLIGTLLSFSLAIGLATATRWAMGF
jgi:hypothetical protein